MATSHMALENLSFLDSVVPMPLTALPVRTVVIQLEGARVMLSPGSRLSDTQLREAGAITDLVAPSLFHTGGMKAAAAAHPKARLWGPKGSREKLPELQWHGLFGVDPWPYDAELTHVALEGMPALRESVFVHRASSALLACDLVFNIEDASGLGARVIFSIFGTWRRFGVSRLFLRAVKDRPAFQTSLASLMTLEFEHLVPAHGATVLGDARPKLLMALKERGCEL